VLLYIDPERGGDTNLSPVIHSDGSLIGIWRKCCHASPLHTGSWPLLARASHWADALSYTFGSEWILPELGPTNVSPEYIPSLGTEDPHLYLDANNRLHALFHNMASCKQYPCPDVAGGHAYAHDASGGNWTYTGVAYSGTNVHFDDGGSFSFSRQERPHVIQNATGHITHLSTAVQYGGEYGDASYTLVQPVQS
jgi:hypothetical protein